MKKKNIIKFFSVLIISVISHFIYDNIQSVLTSIFFPVNESIFDHMKLIITSILLFTIIEYLYDKYKKIDTTNLLLANVISAILGIIFYLIIYLPIDIVIGYKMIVAIGLLIIDFVFTTLIAEKIKEKLKVKYSDLLAIIIIIVSYAIITYLTYAPPHIKLFLDITDNTYGIKKR